MLIKPTEKGIKWNFFRRGSIIACLLIFFLPYSDISAQKKVVSEKDMNRIYQEIKTPYKYGIVLTPEDPSLNIDCPTVFREGDKWYMTYIVFDGRGYESWIATSNDLFKWEILGKTMSFSDSTDWDSNQKAGYPSLLDTKWGGSYELEKYDDKTWMTYIGGSDKGYEAGVLSIGMAYTEGDPATAHEWKRLDKPILSIHDDDDRWWENITLYRSTVIRDPSETLGYPFILLYNAKGNTHKEGEKDAERMGVAASNDMIHWKRIGGEDPILGHGVGITGDPFIQKIGDIWVMFYFGAWWPGTKGAFNNFACSYDLLHWTDWKGKHLIDPSEDYDMQYAHKSSVVKYNGIVYHFYTATDKDGKYRIALATSLDLGKSPINKRLIFK